MSPQDVVALGVLVAGDNVAHFLPHIDKLLAPGRIAHGGELLQDVVLRGFKLPGPVDGTLPQGDTQIGEMFLQIGLDYFPIHGCSPGRSQWEAGDGSHEINYDKSRF